MIERIYIYVSYLGYLMRKQLITSVMLAAIAGMIGLAVVENQGSKRNYTKRRTGKQPATTTKRRSSEFRWNFTRRWR